MGKKKELFIYAILSALLLLQTGCNLVDSNAQYISGSKVWEKIKKEDISKAEKTIELFSDVVLEGSLRKIKYLKKIEKTTMYFFRFDEEEAHLILLEQNQETQQVKKSSKKYQKSREEELFKMLNSGCEIDEKELFEQF